MFAYDREQQFAPTYTYFHLCEYMEEALSDIIYRDYRLLSLFSTLVFGGVIGFFLDFAFLHFLLVLAIYLFCFHTAMYLLFYIIPYYQSRSTNLLYIQRRIDYFQKKADAWCGGRYSDTYDYEDIMKQRRYYRGLVSTEQDYYDSIKKIQASKELEDKGQDLWSEKELQNIQRLRTASSQISTYINNNDLAFLTDVQTAIDDMIDFLKEHPGTIGYISHNIFIYVDELMNILYKFTRMGKGKEKYAEIIAEIATRLSACINETCATISKAEADDIEVSMNVLMNELSDYEGKENLSRKEFENENELDKTDNDNEIDEENKGEELTI